MLFHRRLHLAVALAVVFALTNCDTNRQVDQGTYYLVATNIKSPYWQAAQIGLKRAAAHRKVKAEFVGPDTYKPQEQHEEFQRIMRQNPAGILISVGDRRLMRKDINDAISRGVPVFAIDSDAEYSKRLLFVGTDNFKAGSMIGSTIAETLNGAGNIIVFTMPEQLNLVQRMNGLNEALSRHSRLKVTRVVDIQGDPRIAFDTATEILSKNASKVDAFVCLEAIACPEVADVISRHNVSGKLVVSMDTDARTLDGIKKGFISATIAQKPFTMAYVGLNMLVDLNQSKPPNLDQNWAGRSFSPLPTFVDTGVTLINNENVDAYLNDSALASEGR